MPLDGGEGRLLSRTAAHAPRHDPHKYGLELDTDGWVAVEDLVLALRFDRFAWDRLTWTDLEQALTATTPGRFEIRAGRIRAAYGHSVQLGGAPLAARPPRALFHATTTAALADIFADGLKPMNRQFVHLTADWDYAVRLARSRRGAGTILLVLAEQAEDAGVRFRRANQHVWLAPAVPPAFLTPVLSLTAAAGAGDPQGTVPAAGSGR